MSKSNNRIMLMSKSKPFCAMLLSINRVDGNDVYGDILDEEGIGSSQACEYVIEDVLLNDFFCNNNKEEEFTKLLEQAKNGELPLPYELD